MLTDWRSPYYEGFGASSSGCGPALSSGLATLAASVIPKLGPYAPATVDAIQAEFNAAMQAQPSTVSAISQAFEQNANVELGPVAAPLIALFIKAMVGVNITDPKFVVTTIVTELSRILQPCKDGGGSAAPVVLPPTNVTEGDIGVDVKGRTWFYNAAGQLMVRQPCMKSVPDQVGATATGQAVTLSWKTVPAQCETLELDTNIAKLVSQRLQRGDIVMRLPTNFVAVPSAGGGGGGGSGGAALPLLVGGAALVALLVLRK